MDINDGSHGGQTVLTKVEKLGIAYGGIVREEVQRRERHAPYMHFRHTIV
jgi:hypothetical protein